MQETEVRESKESIVKQANLRDTISQIDYILSYTSENENSAQFGIPNNNNHSIRYRLYLNQHEDIVTEVDLSVMDAYSQPNVIHKYYLATEIPLMESTYINTCETIIKHLLNQYEIIDLSFRNIFPNWQSEIQLSLGNSKTLLIRTYHDNIVEMNNLISFYSICIEEKKQLLLNNIITNFDNFSLEQLLDILPEFNLGYLKEDISNNPNFTKKQLLEIISSYNNASYLRRIRKIINSR